MQVNEDMMKHGLLILVFILLGGCTGRPDGVFPVVDFNKDQFLGKWYEIARLDHSFEKGLSQVTAEYSLRSDGGIRIVNRGYSALDGEWQEAEGKAYFVNEPSSAHLKVSFFGPFYTSYIIFGLDQDNYEYAFVSGFSKSNLWLLARTPTVSDAVISEFVARARTLGFDTGSLIYVKHPKPVLDRS
jgi:apolipoprotein D and lipocalin family protein